MPAATARSRPRSANAHGFNAGTLVGAAGPPATTVTPAVAVPPVPPSTEITAPVTLVCVPSASPVTFALNVHEPPAARVAPVKLIAPDPAVATMVPPPQLPVSPFGDATARPAGSVSVKPTPVNAVEAFGLVSVKLREVDPFRGMLAAPKDFPIVGGAVAAATVTLAEAVPPVPPSTDVTAPVTLFFV